MLCSMLVQPKVHGGEGLVTIALLPVVLAKAVSGPELLSVADDVGVRGRGDGLLALALVVRWLRPLLACTVSRTLA